MSVQFGRWNFDCSPIDPDYIKKAAALIAPYGPDGLSSYARDGLAVLYGAFNTTKKSQFEGQPQVSESGAVIVWDGRLDNRKELIDLLGEDSPADRSDLLLVNRVLNKCGCNAFAHLIGDWALSIWNPTDRTLTLANDFIGARPLYYSRDDAGITWCTILDPLVLLAGRRFQLNEDYLAGLFASFPAPGLTPFVGINSVQPAHFVHIQREKTTAAEYWRFNPSKRIRYREDGEYEEHFRAVFEQSVRRRLRSGAPILAELSGGMDSSSIVCVGDELVATGLADTPRLDTLSYYNDSEPSWDERPYFTKVEEKRGRSGIHIDAAATDGLWEQLDSESFAATPGALRHHSRARAELATCMNSQGNRVVLSGIGGDEFLGGVPDPIPELADLLTRAQLLALVHQLKSWALVQRRPWLRLLQQSLQPFLPHLLRPSVGPQGHAPWLCPGFAKRYGQEIACSKPRMQFFGPLPSFQENISTLNQLRRLISSTVPTPDPLYEKRYPYLDRDLLEFLFAIPREQLLRPGQRRSLMRRSMTGIVPDEVLNRRRKAFLSRTPMAAVSAHWAELTNMSRHMIVSSLGIVEARRLSEALEDARNGIGIPIITLMRVFTIERWLKSLRDHEVLRLPARARERGIDDTPHLQCRAPDKASAS